MKNIKKGVKIHSLIFENSIYIYTGDEIKTFFADSVLVVKRKKSKDMFCAVEINTPKNISVNSFFKNKWQRIIDTPCNDQFIWPIDLILLSESNPQCYLVYNFVSDSIYKSLSKLSLTQDVYGYENKSAQLISLELMKALMFLEENRFLFIGLDDDSVFVNNDRTRILLPLHELMIPDDTKEIYFTQNDFFSEVIDPFSYHNGRILKSRNKIYTYDKNSENFAFVSILFKLMIGIYPFEGPFVSGFEYNVNSAANIEWINRYLQNPVFVFDPVDTSNSISMYNKNIVHCKRWNEISEELRKMFMEFFNHNNVMRSISPTIQYSAEQWYNTLQTAFTPH